MARLKEPVIDWVTEAVAATMLNYTNKRWMRRLVKSGELPIHYTNTRGRKYQYSQADIVAYQNQNSTANA